MDDPSGSGMQMSVRGMDILLTGWDLRLTLPSFDTWDGVANENTRAVEGSSELINGTPDNFKVRVWEGANATPYPLIVGHANYTATDPVTYRSVRKTMEVDSLIRSPLPLMARRFEELELRWTPSHRL